MASQISLLMENQPGALSRVIGLFSQRGYNIDSLSVAPTQDPTLSRLTMTTSESVEIIQQILKQLFKLIDVVMVQDLKASESISLEMALIKVSNKAEVISKIEKNYSYGLGAVNCKGSAAVHLYLAKNFKNDNGNLWKSLESWQSIEFIEI